MNESTFASVAVTLMVLSGIFFVIERVGGRGRNRQQPVFRAGWLTDVVYLFVTALATKPFVRLMFVEPAVLLVIANVVPLETFRSGSYRGFGPRRYVIATLVFHRWHHSREREAWDKNFGGLLPVWDILFGTFYMPRDRFPENFGICEPMPAGFLGQLWEPFAWLIRRREKIDPGS